MGLPVNRKTAKNLAIRRKNGKILTVNRETCYVKNSRHKNKNSMSRLKTATSLKFYE